MIDVKLKISIGDKTIEITEEEATILYTKLHTFFGSKYSPYTPREMGDGIYKPWSNNEIMCKYVAETNTVEI